MQSTSRTGQDTLYQKKKSHRSHFPRNLNAHEVVGAPSFLVLKE